MKYLVDTNIVIDYIRDRGAFGPPAKKLLVLGFLHDFELWVSSSQITDAHYLLSGGGKASLAHEARRKLQELRRGLRVCALTEVDVDAALDSAWPDFEDACLYQCAVRLKADAIVTRNQKDFEKSSIRVFDCEGLFAYLEQEKGLSYDFVPA